MSMRLIGRLAVVLGLPILLMFLAPVSFAVAETALPKEIGCFADNRKADSLGPDGHDLDGAAIKDHAMTVSRCQKLCKEQDFPYAGLQNGSFCYCGEKYGRYKDGKAKCSVKCAGDKSQICGGEAANSVWQVLEEKSAKKASTPSPPDPARTPAGKSPRGTPQAPKRFNKPTIHGYRLDSRPAAGNNFDIVGVANNFCQQNGFSRMLDYHVADARQTIGIDDGNVFTNGRNTNTSFRYILCGQ